MRAYFKSRMKGAVESETVRDATGAALSCYMGATCCIPVEMGRQAIDLALTLTGVRPGDGVVMPSFVCESVILPVLRHGCVPQFADISSDLNISANSVQAAMDNTTRAVIAPHMFGTPMAVDDIRALLENTGIALIEDAAQSLGTRRRGVLVGSYGDFSVLSFGPFKSITATRGGALLLYGQGARNRSLCMSMLWPPRRGDVHRAVASVVKFGMSRITLEAVRRYRTSKHYWSVHACDGPGIDLSETAPRRMPLMDALLLRPQLDRIDSIVARRAANARQLTERLGAIDGLEIPQAPCRDSTFVKYVVALDERRMPGGPVAAVHYLRDFRIEAELPYEPLHLRHKWGAKSVHLPNTEMIWKKLVYLPMHSRMTESGIDYMASVMTDYLKSLATRKPLRNVRGT